MRVYSSLLILKEIMENIIREEKSYPDEPIQTYGPAKSSYHPLVPPKPDVWLPCHYFDYIGGTETGGLVAIMLGRLRMNVHDSILAFEAVLKELFHHRRWFHSRSLLFWPRAKFDHRILEQAIQNLVSHRAPGVTANLSRSNFAFNEDQCKTVVLAFRSLEGNRAHVQIPCVFRTYQRIDREGQTFNSNPSPAHHIPIWQVARATTASPTFFRPVIIGDHEYVSGNFGMNNPSVEIYHEVQNMDGIDSVDMLLSIGSGKPRIPSLVSLLLMPHQPLHSSGLQRIPSQLTSRRDYYRLDVEVLGQLKMDEWQAGSRMRTNIGSLIGRRRSKKKAALLGQGYQTAIANPDNTSVPNIKNAILNIAEWFQPKNVTEESILKHTRDYLDQEDVQSKINTVAKSLVKKRRNRVKSDLERWKEFCAETWYCIIFGCPEPEAVYTSRSALRTHILDKHSDKYWRRDQEALKAALDEGQIKFG